MSRDLKEPSFEKFWEKGVLGRVSKFKCTNLQSQGRCKGSPWQAVGDEGWGRAEAGCRGVLLAMVRSLGFIRNAVGEARGFNIGHIRFSFCVRDHCSCWVEDCRSQEPKGLVTGSILLSGLGRTRKES